MCTNSMHSTVKPLTLLNIVANESSASISSSKALSYTATTCSSLSSHTIICVLKLLLEGSICWWEVWYLLKVCWYGSSCTLETLDTNTMTLFKEKFEISFHQVMIPMEVNYLSHSHNTMKRKETSFTGAFLFLDILFIHN